MRGESSKEETRGTSTVERKEEREVGVETREMGRRGEDGERMRRMRIGGGVGGEEKEG